MNPLHKNGEFACYCQLSNRFSSLLPDIIVLVSNKTDNEQVFIKASLL